MGLIWGFMKNPLPPKQESGAGARVSDGTRTRDIRDHNAALYQLSYTHHRSETQHYLVWRRFT